MLFALMGFGVVTAIILWLKRRATRKQVVSPGLGKPQKDLTFGLTDAEAEERRSDSRIKARMLAEQREQILQGTRRVFSIFNITMLVLAVSQLLLKNYWGALGTFGALVLNISLSLYHQARSAREVGRLLSKARPDATAIRNGALKTIDQDDIVIGDVLVVGVGDEIFTRGTILQASNFLVDQSRIVPDGGHVEKTTNDPVLPGTFCERGWAAYRVESYPGDVRRDEISLAATSLSDINTPLQKSIRVLLFGLLVIAGVFYAIILAETLRFDVFPAELLPMYREVLSLIFSIAPAGLLFMIVVNYALGSATIAKSGVLLRNSYAIESLAQTTSMCIMRRGNHDAVGLKIEMVRTEDEEMLFSESRARQLLGSYAHSVGELQFPGSVMQASLEGDARQIDQQARYLSLLGWEAVTFSSPDLRGTFVIGDPQKLTPNLTRPISEVSVEESLDEEKETGGGNFFSRLTQRLGARNSAKGKAEGQGESLIFTSGEDSEDTLTVPEKVSDALYQRVQMLFGDSDKEEAVSEKVETAESSGEVFRLLFAYSPVKQELINSNHIPVCPENLTPVCYIIFVSEARPEMQRTVDGLKESSAAIKVFTTEAPDIALGLAAELGLVDETSPDSVISGEEFDDVVAEKGAEVFKETVVYSQLSSDQTLDVIRGLQSQGEFVAVRGNTISDLPVMTQADLRISTRGSSPLVLSKTDIVIMNNSPDSLPLLLQTGQRIVQSVMDMLKLNISEIGYLLILLILMFITNNRFFVYQPIHGTLVGTASIVIPSFFITLWQSTIKFNRLKMRKQIYGFVLPAMLTISLFVLTGFLVARGIGVRLSYRQQLITHFLLLVGLFQVVVLQPPLRIFSIDGVVYKDWRLTKVVIVLYVLVTLLTFVPLFQKYMHFRPLQPFFHYLIIWGLFALWAYITMTIWRYVWKRQNN